MSTEAPPLYDGKRDIERAIAELSERIPAPLFRLARLAYNYRWCWLPGATALFREIDPDLWRHSGCNPRYVIEAVAPHRLRELAGNAAFVEQVEAFGTALKADLDRPWAETMIPGDRPIAYCCAEFGVHCSLPLYGGGLGVLAGDLLKAASDLALPMVGIGLLYRQGYFHQRLDAEGWQNEHWTTAQFERLPAVRVTGPDDQPLTVEVFIRDHLVRVQVWRIDVGRIPLYLLDTDRDDNDLIDRWITARLYVGDRHTRLAQYAVLGICGVRLLRALRIQPTLVHLNEGHAVLSSFERMRTLRAAGHSVEDALALVRQETVFTTHTPVAAGNEGYREDEVEPVLRKVIDRLGIPRTLFYDLARLVPGNRHEPAAITTLALRTSRASNGVSRRHGIVARGMWQPLWPERAAEDVPIGHITNGVHTSTWMAAPMQQLLDRRLGADWRGRIAETGFWEQIMAIPDGELWQVRCQQRQELIHYVREKSVRDRLARGESPEYVKAAAEVFDAGVFTIGFARRVATYKRLHLLSTMPATGLTRLLADGPTPLQFVLAGKAHPQDQEAKQGLRDRFRLLKHDSGIPRRVVFLEDYDLHMAPRIVAGVDLWLNLPRPPLEASGTSGMKVTLNGGLNLSVLDGWWEEAYDGISGWAIKSPDDEPHVQDERDAAALLHLLEREVIPLFYERTADGIPHAWLQRVKTAMRNLIPKFTAERMLRDYIDSIYVGAAR